MKVLIVASCNSGKFSPFVVEQVNALKCLNVEIDYFGITGSGIKGYLGCKKKFIQKIKEFTPDIVHAHYGLAGLLANLQRKVPVITTYHGSDIHSLGFLLVLSKICMRLSKYNIFVTNSLYNIAKYKKNNAIVIPCGVNTSEFKKMSKEGARKIKGYSTGVKLALFSNAFDRKVKNGHLAKSAVTKLENIELIELKGYTRDEVVALFNIVDVALMTSFNEGSPQFIKEAMACGTPIVTTDVGDVRWVMGDTKGCYICSYEPQDCADKIRQAIEFSEKYGSTNGRKRIDELGLDNKIVAKKIIEIYNTITHCCPIRI